MAPFGRGSNAMENFDDFDPTPYGGGYDIFLIYGRPIPPSHTTCYPIASESYSANRPDHLEPTTPPPYGRGGGNKGSKQGHEIECGGRSGEDGYRYGSGRTKRDEEEEHRPRSKPYWEEGESTYSHEDVVIKQNGQGGEDGYEREKGDLESRYEGGRSETKQYGGHDDGYGYQKREGGGSGYDGEHWRTKEYGQDDGRYDSYAREDQREGLGHEHSEAKRCGQEDEGGYRRKEGEGYGYERRYSEALKHREKEDGYGYGYDRQEGEYERRDEDSYSEKPNDHRYGRNGEEREGYGRSRYDANKREGYSWRDEEEHHQTSGYGGGTTTHYNHDRGHKHSRRSKCEEDSDDEEKKSPKNGHHHGRYRDE